MHWPEPMMSSGQYVFGAGLKARWEPPSDFQTRGAARPFAPRLREACAIP